MQVVNLVSLGIISIVIFIYLSKLRDEYTLVRSSYDSREYLVRKLPDAVQASNNLARIREKLLKLVQSLQDQLKDPKFRESLEAEKFTSSGKASERIYVQDIQRLIENFRDDVLSESPENSRHTSYSVNKGEEVYFCLRERDQNNQLIDLNTLTFVALHEMAHLMTKSIGHEPEFWKNFRFLLEEAIRLRLYEYTPYHLKPVPYCGTMISDTPLKK